MKFKYYLGIDISKERLDLCLIYDDEVIFFNCKNAQSEIKKILKNILKDFNLQKTDLLICAEHTGKYGYKIKEVCCLNNYNLWMESAVHIKNSQGLQRGKDDKKDAFRIAIYAKRFSDKVSIYKPCDQVFEKLSYLNTERDLLVIDAAKYKAQLKDDKEFISKGIFSSKQKRYKNIIQELQKAILIIEEEIDKLVQEDPLCKQQFELLTSIDGVGRQVAVNTMVATEGFTKFTDHRKFACHAGVAPFKYYSGSSIRSANRVSQKANKKLKKLLHMAAVSSIRFKGEFKTYFERKVKEGKNKLTVINAIRAKIIARMFAVIKHDRKYDKIYTPAIV